MAKQLMKGAEVIGASAIKAGCKNFFGYPITPQNEVPEYMSRELPKIGGAFVQAESEVAAINMVYGAAGTGNRVFTSSSSPGIALKQEGITYLAGAELPCVITSISRSGPGLGGILPSQADYFQATRGGGNGDYRVPVYAPSDLQEMSDLMQKAFYIADKYRNPVMLLADGMLAQMMEPVEIKDLEFPEIDHSGWAANGEKAGREPHIVTSVHLSADVLEEYNVKNKQKYNTIEKEEVMYENYLTEDAEIVVVSYGSAARVVRNAIENLREEGIKVGLIRPITLWPFPHKAFDEIPNAKVLLSAELSQGQMIDDVRIAAKGRWEVDFYGRSGGNVFATDEIENKVREMLKEL
jgi:2-oxoglutarate ferredoxin oxidoreductase subunit alpha